TSLEADQYQSLRLSLQRLKAARDVRMIAMTSPTTGDGKTLTAINLAGALAGVGSRVLLIEADLRRPSVASQLGIPGNTAPRPPSPAPGRGRHAAGAAAAAGPRLCCNPRCPPPGGGWGGFHPPPPRSDSSRGARALRLRGPRHAASRACLRLSSFGAVRRRT